MLACIIYASLAYGLACLEHSHRNMLKRHKTSKDVFQLKVELIMAGDCVIIDTGGIHMHMCSSLREVSSYATYAIVC